MTTAQTTPAAAPCFVCGTERGYIPAGKSFPMRPRGYCNACYQRLRAAMSRHGYRTFVEAEQHLPLAHGANRVSHNRNARERAQSRQLAIRDHVGAHITTPRPTGQRPMPCPSAWGTPATDPLARAPWFAKEYAAAEAA